MSSVNPATTIAYTMVPHHHNLLHLPIILTTFPPPPHDPAGNLGTRLPGDLEISESTSPLSTAGKLLTTRSSAIPTVVGLLQSTTTPKLLARLPAQILIRKCLSLLESRLFTSTLRSGITPKPQPTIFLYEPGVQEVKDDTHSPDDDILGGRDDRIYSTNSPRMHLDHNFAQKKNILPV